MHKWFLFDALRADIAPTPDGSEFVDWRWVDPDWLVGHVPDWRRPAYERVPGIPVSDLFTAAAEQHLRSSGAVGRPACGRERSTMSSARTTSSVPGKPLRRLVEQDRLTSAIFWGPPGTGKTTLALAVAGTTKRAFEQMSAVNAGVKDVREVIERARHRLGEHGRGTILFLDEIHRFSKAQQDASAAGGRRRHADADRRHHREPVLRGQPAAAQPQHAVPAGAAESRGHRGAGSPWAAGRGTHGRPRTPSSISSIGPAATADRC